MPKPHASRIKEFEVEVLSPENSSTKKHCNFNEEKEDSVR